MLLNGNPIRGSPYAVNVLGAVASRTTAQVCRVLGVDPLTSHSCARAAAAVNNNSIGNNDKTYIIGRAAAAAASSRLPPFLETEQLPSDSTWRPLAAAQPSRIAAGPRHGGGHRGRLDALCGAHADGRG